MNARSIYVFRLGAMLVVNAGVYVWGSTAQTPAGPIPQATFKGSTEIVQLDVSVLGPDGRPLEGLTAADFTVLKDGKSQPVIAVVPIEIPRPAVPSASWMQDFPSDVASNELDVRRLVVIVIDDANTGVDHGESRSVRLIANRIIDELGPSDLAAVTFTYLGGAQNLTTDRTRLRRAVDSFAPRNFGRGAVPLACQLQVGGCVISTLTSVGSVLRSAPQGRKMVMFISSTGAVQIRTDPFAPLSPAQEMFRTLQQANVSVYAFNPVGLVAGGTIGDWRHSQRGLDDLQTITDATGGRTVAGTNTPEDSVPQIFHQNSLYYLVGFRPTDTASDGRFHRVQIRVNRPGVIVRTRSGYFAPPESKPTRHRSSATPLESALLTGLPVSQLPLRVSVAAFAQPGRREAALAVVAGVHPGGTEQSAQRLDFVAAAFDRDWKKRAEHRQTLEVTPKMQGGAQFETLARLGLTPGRYEVRVAVESGGRVGAVLTSIDVPDFAKKELTLSGLLIGRNPSGALANQRLLADLVPMTPTTVRQFARTDNVQAFVRIYHPAHKTQGSDVVLWRIVNSHDTTVFEYKVDLNENLVAHHGVADSHIQIPLSQLQSGDYLLSVEATGSRKVRQDVKFRVQ